MIIDFYCSWLIDLRISRFTERIFELGRLIDSLTHHTIIDPILFFQQFLHAKCPDEWPADMVDSKLGDKWHASTNPCQGSSGMTKCVRQNAGAIGYLDSGHGWSEELAEVSLKNEDGKYLTSADAYSKGGITYAASSGVTPDRADLDWSSVEFLNKVGPMLFLISHL